MIQDQIAQIEQKLEQAGELSPQSRAELLALLADLKIEIRELSKTNLESAHQVAGFAAASAAEATRQPRAALELETALQGFKGSVAGLEASHPKLTNVVNQISMVLANMGI